MPLLQTQSLVRLLLLLVTASAVPAAANKAADHDAVESALESALPSYHYGAPIAVECMNRSSETGEHIENKAHEIQWIPFPTCSETSAPLQFQYGVEGEINCTIPVISDPFFHLLEFYIHSDAPLSCRLPARPAPHPNTIGGNEPAREYIPLVIALAGTLQLSHMHISTHLNVLLHSTPKHHIHPHDSGVLDSGTAYSTSPLTHMAGSATRRLVIGDPLPLSFSVRWFPTPSLPKVQGKVEWSGMGGHIYASTVFYIVLSFLAGIVVASVYFFGSVLPKRLRDGAWEERRRWVDMAWEASGMDGDTRRGRWTEMGDAVCPSTLSAFGDFGRGIGYFGPGIPGVGQA